MKQKVVIKKTGTNIIDFFKSSKFGAALLICSTILESLYAFKLFMLTGQFAFNEMALIVAIIYAVIVAGTIVFFALRNNRMIVWAAVIFELTMNILLDVQAVALMKPENWFWIFVSQMAIGAILPLATKAFADEVGKRELTRKPRMK